MVFTKKCEVLVRLPRWSILVPPTLYMALIAATLRIPLKSPVKPPLASELVSIPSPSSHVQEIPQQEFLYDGHDPRKLLEDIFIKADKDSDNFLTLEELSLWIHYKVKEHINQALTQNYGLFTMIDINPRNGLVTWEEYHKYFMKTKGFDDEFIKEHDERHRSLSRSIKETIMRDRASWSEAAKTDPDHLTLDEFLAFRHPESSHATILLMVEELYEKFDRDADELLTEDEFSQLPTDGEDQHEGDAIRQSEAERRKEFRELIDLDHSGKADRRELLMYIDPKNPRHSKEEASSLVVLADTNHDGRLSLSEILAKMDLFLGSKMVDTARAFHDEF